MTPEDKAFNRMTRDWNIRHDEIDRAKILVEDSLKYQALLIKYLAIECVKSIAIKFNKAS